MYLLWLDDVASEFISKYFVQIGPFPGSINENTRIKVKVQLNLHGIVAIESAMVNMNSLFLFCILINFVPVLGISYLV